MSLNGVVTAVNVHPDEPTGLRSTLAPLKFGGDEQSNGLVGEGMDVAEGLALAALVVAAAFTGAAVYVNLVEHPARRTLDARAALREWQPAYKRGAAMQSSLALVGFVLAGVAAFLGAGALVAAGAVLMIAPWPWTYLAIMPLNKQLLAMTPDTTGPDVHPRLERWETLHRVRTLLGAAATACLLWAALIS